MRHFTSAKPDRRLYLVADLQPLAGALHPVAIVVLVCARTKLNFLNDNYGLLLFRLVRFLLGLILELAEIDDPANRRIRAGRDFDEIQALLTGCANRVACIHDTKLFAFIANNAHLRHANSLVNTRHGRASKIRPAPASKTCSYFCTSMVRVLSFESLVSS